MDVEGKNKADFIRELHAQVRANIERKSEHYARQANKGRVRVVFQPGDWVWVHLRKERFAAQRKTKLHPRGDGPFQVLERINENAYKIDLPSHYGNVSATFNVSDLSLYDAGDSRTNLFEEGGNDEDHQASTDSKFKAKDPLQHIGGPMTRAKAKQVREALQGLVMKLQDEALHLPITQDESKVVNIA